MSLTFNNSISSTQLIITTHSPYVLTSINNLIQASISFNNSDETGKEKITKLIPKELMINEKYLNAYSFNNETAESIVDSETGLIFSQYLDAVSEEISIEFDNLLNFE
jgi:hypothetical protein